MFFHILGMTERLICREEAFRMSFGDFGGFGGWSPQEHALNKLVFDEAHKKGSSGSGGGGGDGNSGCLTVLLAAIIVFIFKLAGC
jgi:hypothetical protein